MRLLRAGVAGLLLAGLMAVPTVSQDEPLDRIDLPDGWRPEGITALDGKLYVGSLADGAIWVVDPADPSSGRVFAPGHANRVTVGVEADPAGESIWAAGGSTGKIRAYSIDGEGPTTWTTEDGLGFYSDIAATEDGVYLTDSFVPQLEFMPPPVTGRANFFRSVPFSGELEYIDGAFNVNGVVAVPGGLIVVQSTPGALFRVECGPGYAFPQTCETFRIDTGDIQLSGGDGLELDGDVLYVVRNSGNVVTAVRLDQSLTSASLVAEFRHPDLDTPTTAALIGDDLWVVNARFGTPAAPDTEYWLTRLDAIGGTDG